MFIKLPTGAWRCFFLYLYTLWELKGRTVTPLLHKLFLGELYRYYSGYKVVLIPFEQTTACSILRPVSEVCHIHGFIVILFFDEFWLDSCDRCKLDTGPSLLCYVHGSERMRIFIWLVKMMRTFCHHVLANQMTLYICSDMCTQSKKDGHVSGLHPSQQYNHTSFKKNRMKPWMLIRAGIWWNIDHCLFIAYTHMLVSWVITVRLILNNFEQQRSDCPFLYFLKGIQ